MKQIASPASQRGAIALIFALLMVTLIASIAATVSYNMTLDLRRTESLLQQEQARQVAVGAEKWIANVLAEDKAAGPDDHLGELWAQPLPPLPVQGAGGEGFIAGQITDLQSRFNLNNLVNEQGEPDPFEVERFQLMLTRLDLDPNLANAVVDWIDSDTNVTFPGGAEDDTYAGRIPAFNAANQFFRSSGELALVEGFDQAAMTALLPHIVALPERTQINVNTATPIVLTSLDSNLDASRLDSLIQQRLENGFEDLEQAFVGILPAETVQTLTKETQYFQIRSIVRIGTLRFTMYSLLYRDAQGGTAVLLRSLGTAL
ncbi:MAG: type II secretion system minor pseudopilin GspK [Pseudomonadota bacterium]